MIDEDVLRKRLQILARRGLLELDILLSRFMISSTYSQLKAEELLICHRLLEEPDPVLLKLLQGEIVVEDKPTDALIQKIRYCKEIFN